MRVLGIEVIVEEMRFVKERSILKINIWRNYLYMEMRRRKVLEKMIEKKDILLIKEVKERENDKVSEEEEGWFNVKRN